MADEKDDEIVPADEVISIDEALETQIAMARLQIRQLHGIHRQLGLRLWIFLFGSTVLIAIVLLAVFYATGDRRLPEFLSQWPALIGPVALIVVYTWWAALKEFWRAQALAQYVDSLISELELAIQEGREALGEYSDSTKSSTKYG